MMGILVLSRLRQDCSFLNTDLICKKSLTDEENNFPSKLFLSFSAKVYIKFLMQLQ